MVMICDGYQVVFFLIVYIYNFFKYTSPCSFPNPYIKQRSSLYILLYYFYERHVWFPAPRISTLSRDIVHDTWILFRAVYTRMWTPYIPVQYFSTIMSIITSVHPRYTHRHCTKTKFHSVSTTTRNSIHIGID